MADRSRLLSHIARVSGESSVPEKPVDSPDQTANELVSLEIVAACSRRSGGWGRSRGQSNAFLAAIGADREWLQALDTCHTFTSALETYGSLTAQKGTRSMRVKRDEVSVRRKKHCCYRLPSCRMSRRFAAGTLAKSDVRATRPHGKYLPLYVLS